MTDYLAPSKHPDELEPMRGIELVYFVIPEAVRWSVVHSVLILEGPLDVGLLRNRIQHGYGRFHRLRQRPVYDGRRFFWEPVDDVDLDAHLLTLPPGVAETQKSLESYLGERLSQPLDPTRPLWQVCYLPQYEGGAALLLRIHHAYGDGRALQAIATSLLEESARASLEWRERSSPTVRNAAIATSLRPLYGRRRAPSTGTGTRSRLPQRLRDLLRACVELIEAFTRDRTTGFDAMPSEEKVAAIGRPLPRRRLRHASRRLDCTLNDLVLAGLSGAIRHHLERKGIDPSATRLTISLPVDLHSASSMSAMLRHGVLTNRLGTISVRLPVPTQDARERVRVLARDVSEKLNGGEAIRQYRSFASLHRMPRTLLVRMFRSQAHRLSGIVSNLAGPRRTYFVAGRAIVGWLFWVTPAELAGSHIGLSVTHYRDDIRLALTLPANSGYDARRLLEEIISEVEGLADEALGKQVEPAR